MDELDILKRDWKKKENAFNQVSEKEIYGMLHKRSSSIVKWILIISILEILFWVSLSWMIDDKETSHLLETYHIKTITNILTYLNYGVVLFFIYNFYRNYRTINTTDSIKQLMQSIIKTRKTVQYYVWYNIGMTFLSFLLVFYFQFKYDPKLNELINQVTDKISPTVFYTLIFLMYFIIAIVVVVFIWLFYKLLYGILMRRLKSNYDELKKLDL